MLDIRFVLFIIIINKYINNTYLLHQIVVLDIRYSPIYFELYVSNPDNKMKIFTSHHAAEWKDNKVGHNF